MTKKNCLEFLSSPSECMQMKSELMSVIEGVIENQSYRFEPIITEVENKLAEYVRTRYAVGVRSGTDALIIALKACNIGMGDEVITTPFTFFATSEAIALCGAEPIFVDISDADLNINTRRITDSITPRTKAILPVHLFGYPADMISIERIASKHELQIIADMSHAIGTELNGKSAGSYGDISCLSLNPTKALSGIGSGGMIFTNYARLRGIADALRNHGRFNGKKEHHLIGMNSRLDGIQAATILLKLEHIDSWIERRRFNFMRLHDTIQEIDDNDLLNIQYDLNIATTPAYLFPIRVLRGIGNFLDFLRSKGIPFERYDQPIHLQPAFKYLHHSRTDFPIAEGASKQVVVLPIHPFIDIDHIAQSLIEYARGKQSLRG